MEQQLALSMSVGRGGILQRELAEKRRRCYGGVKL